MIIIGNTIVSDDLREAFFSCNLSECFGACCVDGDAGAPLEENEIGILEDMLQEIIPFMSDKGKDVVRKNGVFDYDSFGHFVTPLVYEKECAFVVVDEKGIAFCAIEQAFLEKRISFQKPISCHLYPVRINNHTDFDAVNYHQWHICKSACKKGEEQKILLYKFLKTPLIRKFGQNWYDELVLQIENRK